MSIRPDDQERLPPMISYEDVQERQRLEDLKEFRKYLVDTSTVKCLAKMYQHAVKNELRIDNPKLVTQFLAGYTDGNPDAEEIRQLSRENATLEEYNGIMAEQVQDLEREVARQQRLRLARKLWRHFCLGLPENESEVAMTLNAFFIRLCGKEVEPSTGQVLVDLLRPEAYMDTEVTSTTLSKESFCAIVADGDQPESLLAWLEEELLARLDAGESGEAPFQKGLMQAIIESDLLPHDTFLLADAVKLDPQLVALLEAVAAGPKEPVAAQEPADAEAPEDPDAHMLDVGGAC